MEAKREEKDEKVSSVSGSNYTSSSKSSVASADAKAQAKAEAARTRVTFAQKELELKKQRAKLDLEKTTVEADLEALELEKAAAAANAEAEVLEAAAGVENEDLASVRSSVSPQTIREQTEDYLEHQAQVSSTPITPSSAKPSALSVEEMLTKWEDLESSPKFHHDVSPTMPRYTQQGEYLTRVRAAGTPASAPQLTLSPLL